MSETPMRVCVAGAGGRMGRALIGACVASSGVELGGACEREGSDLVGLDAGAVAAIGPLGVNITADVEQALRGVDAFIDFTLPEAVVRHAGCCADAGAALVIGTTGLDTGQRGAVVAAAARIPVVMAPNMSVGVNVCLELVATAARVLGDEVDIEVIETHHRHKVDAPSGTALRFGEVAAAATGRALDDCAVFARHGRTGARAAGAIGFSAIRGGDIVGDHTVLFAGAGERVEITHRAASRGNYAHGALRAANWLRGRAPGLYDMADVLGLR